MASNASVLPNETELRTKMKTMEEDFLVSEIPLDDVAILFQFYGEPERWDEQEGFEYFDEYPLSAASEDEEDDDEYDDENYRKYPSSSAFVPPQNFEPSHEWTDTPVTPHHFVFSDSFFKVKPRRQNPKSYFDLIFSDEFFDKIISNTNKKGKALFGQSSLEPWSDINRREMDSFFSISFHMATVKSSVLSDYWSQFDGLFYPKLFKKFPKQMPLNRYSQIRQAFSFTDDILTSTELSEVSVYQILPLLDFFSKTMEKIHYPGQQISISESVVPWGLNASTKQYRNLRFNKYGIQPYMLCDTTGLIYKIIVYVGSFSVKFASKLVHQMMKGLKQGHSLYLNKILNSVSLIGELLNIEKCYCTGPLFPCRKDSPQKVVEKKLENNELIQQWIPNEGICVSKWLTTKKTFFFGSSEVTKKTVLMASSEFTGDLIETSKNRVFTKWSHSSVKYSKNKTGINQLEEALMDYRHCLQTLPWYTRFQFRILEIMLFNTYTLFIRYSGKYMDYYRYRLAIVDSLCTIEEDSESEEECQCSEEGTTDDEEQE